MDVIHDKRSGRAPKMQPRDHTPHGQGAKNPAATSKQNRAGLSLRGLRPEEALAGLSTSIALGSALFILDQLIGAVL